MRIIENRITKRKSINKRKMRLLPFSTRNEWIKLTIRIIIRRIAIESNKVNIISYTYQVLIYLLSTCNYKNQLNLIKTYNRILISFDMISIVC